MPKSGTQIGALTAAAHRIGLSLAEWEARTRAGLKWCYRCRRWLYSMGEHGRFGVDRSRGDWTRSSCRECLRVETNGRRLLKRGPPMHYSEQLRDKLGRFQGRLIPLPDH